MRMNRVLWIVQGLLAALFLFAGGIKLVMPIAPMAAQMPVPLPGWFLQFVGVCEVLGALGLVLPGLFHVREDLTPLAACGLVVIMIGAAVITLMGGVIAPALFPLALGLLLLWIARSRWPTLTQHRQAIAA